MTLIYLSSPGSKLSRLRPLVLAAVAVCLIFAGRPSTVQAQDESPLRAVGMLQVDGVSTSVLQAAEASVKGPDGEGKDGPLASVGMELAVLYHQHRVAGARGVQALQEASRARPKADTEGPERGAQRRIHSPISADGQYVTVDAIASDGASGLSADLRRLGLEDGATAGTVVSGRLPISSIKDAASLSSLRGMVPSYVRTQVGSAESEADSAHFADTARLNTGTNGSGQKVCALSDSYNQNESALTTAADDVQSGDLPGDGNPVGNTTPVDVLPNGDNVSDGSDEGRAMLQLIHDIAPGATLGFHTAFGGIPVFTSGIRELADAGCTVIVDDVRYSAEPFYQDGPVANAVDDVVTNDNVAYFSSAGNDGENSYEAPFRDSGKDGFINSSSIPHDFDSTATGTDTRQEITVLSGGTFQIFSFQWTDPSARVDGSESPDTDLDVALVDGNDNVVAQGSNDNISNGVPVEFLEYTNDSGTSETLFLVIEKAAGPDPDEVKYVYSGNGFTIEEFDVSNPTIFGHPVADSAMAVAAAPFFATAAFRSDIDSSAFLEFFSSKGGKEGEGGIPVLFDQSGNRLLSPVRRQKPEVTGTDAVDNTFFGQFSGENGDIPDSALGGIDPDPFPNFAGTSAAAPNIAAIAALIREAAPGLTPTQVYDRLEDTAVDVQFRRKIEDGELVLEQIDAGVDPWSGHGFVRADRAVPTPAGVQITDATAKASSSNRRAIEVAWRNVGEERESVDEFLLEKRFFNEPFVEQERIPAGGTTEFARTVEDLPAGEHTFQISAIRNDSTLARKTVSAVVRRQEVDVSVFPNPFAEGANLSVTLPEAPGREAQETELRITVRVFDVLGRQVATPIAGKEIRRSGATSLSLNSGLIRSLASGVYFFQVRGEDFVETTRAVRVR